MTDLGLILKALSLQPCRSVVATIVNLDFTFSIPHWRFIHSILLVFGYLPESVAKMDLHAVYFREFMCLDNVANE